jgi:Xaa-Pro aminopeptidase
MFAERRSRLLDRLRARGAAAVVPTSAHKIRNHDSHYRFRPDSDFWYLTGLAEPDAVLVLRPRGAPGTSGGPQSVLFLREKDREQEIWNGRRLGVAAAPGALGVDEARPIERLHADLPALLEGCERIVYRTGIDEARDRAMLESFARMRARARGLVPPPVELLDTGPFVHEMRLKKSPEEVAILRRAAAIAREAHVLAMRAARPGVGEHEIDALLEHTFRRLGSTGAAYTPIVAGGANATILHYVENDRPLVDGDLLLVDAGAESEYYASDVTRTYPVGERFSDDQLALYEIVLAAQQAAIDEVRPGAAFTDPHERAVRLLCEGLARLGLLKEAAGEAIESGSYRRFYMHRTSHWLGLDVHDCGAYVQNGAPRVLEPGMVLTIEPGIYVAPDDETVEPRWRGIGIRIEDDVLVGEAGCEVLTEGIPKTVAEIEEARRRRVPHPRVPAVG